MTITTLRDLEALPIGQHVRVAADRNQIFARVDGGFARDGVTIDFKLFTGALKAGLVEAFDLSVTIGDWYSHPSYTHRHTLVVDAGSSGRWRVLHTREGRYYSFAEVNPQDLLDLVKSDAPPEHLDSVLLTFAQAMSVSERPPLSPQQVNDLHSYAEDNAGTDHGDRFEDLLASIGFGRGADHPIVLVITGTTTVVPDPKQAERLLGPDFRVTDVAAEVTMTWAKTVNLSRYGIGCTCDQITEAEVMPHLPPGTTSFTWSVDH
jgi:uncharacterized protein (DUF736 family)